jgi:hypothetical protein
MHVWISHSSDGAEFATALRAALLEHGIEVQVGLESIRAGEGIATRITGEIQASDAILAIITPATAKSLWVSSELAMALSSGKRLIPILADAAAEVPYLLRQLHYVDMSAPDSFERGVESVLEGLRRAPDFRRNETASELHALDHLQEQLRLEQQAYMFALLTHRSRLSFSVAVTAVVSAILAVVVTLVSFYRDVPQYTTFFTVGLAVASSILTALILMHFRNRPPHIGDDSE